MAITKIDTDMIANDAITADKIAAGALDTQLAGYLSTNSFATESYVGTAISNLVDSSPATLDTLNELAAALGDDPNFATTTATAIGLKAPLASPSFTGAAIFGGNVGIAGQTSPTYKLDGGFADQTWGWYLNSSYNAGMTYNTAERSLLIHTKSAENIDHIKFATSSTGAERMRIDASGNLLVGKTTTTFGTAGIALRGTVADFTRDGGCPINVNRLTSGGSLIDFHKEGSLVGSIGVAASNYLAIGNNNTSIQFYASGIAPATGYPSALTDASKSLGSAGFRFKDLYLSGNVKASNLQLLEGATQTGGIFKEKDLIGSGTSTATSIFSETGSGIKFFVNGSVPAVATIDTSGNLGIGGTLSVDSNIIAPSVYANVTGGSPNLVMYPGGLFQRTGSSLRYKNTVNDATHGLTELLTLRPVTYKGNNDGDTIFGGLIAEEVHDAGLTEFVQYGQDGEPDGIGYGNMVSLCIKAIQEQQAIIQEQQALTAALTARIEALEGDL